MDIVGFGLSINQTFRHKQYRWSWRLIRRVCGLEFPIKITYNSNSLSSSTNQYHQVPIQTVPSSVPFRSWTLILSDDWCCKVCVPTASRFKKHDGNLLSAYFSVWKLKSLDHLYLSVLSNTESTNYSQFAWICDMKRLAIKCLSSSEGSFFVRLYI